MKTAQKSKLSDNLSETDTSFPEKSNSASLKPKRPDSCIFLTENAEQAVTIRFLLKFFLQNDLRTRIIIFVPISVWEDERYDNNQIAPEFVIATNSERMDRYGISF